MTIEDEEKHKDIDRVIPWDMLEEAEAIALAENPQNGADTDAETGNKLSVEKRCLWRNGRTLRVRFLGGTPFLRKKVEQYAREWTKHANLHFEFTDDPEAEIRVAFGDYGPRKDRSSWSAMGCQALVERYFPRDQPTMNFGWLEDSSPEEELSRVLLHELGHAIGCIHEHEIPEGGIQWNEAAVLKYYSGYPNYWDEETIRFNILHKYSKRQIKGTTFDPDSIMLYAVDPDLTLDGYGTHANSKLSAMDVEFIAKVYPKP